MNESFYFNHKLTTCALLPQAAPSFSVALLMCKGVHAFIYFFYFFVQSQQNPVTIAH